MRREADDSEDSDDSDDTVAVRPDTVRGVAAPERSLWQRRLWLVPVERWG